MANAGLRTAADWDAALTAAFQANASKAAGADQARIPALRQWIRERYGEQAAAQLQEQLLRFSRERGLSLIPISNLKHATEAEVRDAFDPAGDQIVFYVEDYTGTLKAAPVSPPAAAAPANPPPTLESRIVAAAARLTPQASNPAETKFLLVDVLRELGLTKAEFLKEYGDYFKLSGDVQLKNLDFRETTAPDRIRGSAVEIGGFEFHQVEIKTPRLESARGTAVTAPSPVAPTAPAAPATLVTPRVEVLLRDYQAALAAGDTKRAESIQRDAKSRLSKREFTAFSQSATPAPVQTPLAAPPVRPWPPVQTAPLPVQPVAAAPVPPVRFDQIPEPIRPASDPPPVEIESLPEDFEFPQLDTAYRFLQERKVLTAAEFRRLSDEEKVSAVTLQGESEDNLRAFRDQLAKSIRTGDSLDEFQDQIEVGEQVQPHEIEAHFRTATKQAYLAGQDEVMESPVVAGAFPYVAMFATNDGRTRPEHEALSGLIVERNSPAHRVIQKALRDWGCRCAPVSYTAEEVKGQKIHDKSDLPAIALKKYG
jgi:hypothetical protein